MSEIWSKSVSVDILLNLSTRKICCIDNHSSNIIVYKLFHGYSGFYTKLNIWGSLGLNFDYDGGPIIENGGPICSYMDIP